MRKVLFITLAALLVGGILALAGCTPEETPTTNPLADRVTALEGDVSDTASSMANLANQLNSLKNQVNGIVIPTIPNIPDYQSDIDALYAARTSLNASITNLQNQINAIEIPDQYVPIDQMTATAELGTSSLVITTHSPAEAWVYFEIIFKLNAPLELDPVDVGGSNSINDAIKYLGSQWFDGTDLFVRANVGANKFYPEFTVHWNADDEVWELLKITFDSIPTTIDQGEDTKSVSVATVGLTDGAYVTVVIHPIAEASAPSTW